MQRNFGEHSAHGKWLQMNSARARLVCLAKGRRSSVDDKTETILNLRNVRSAGRAFHEQTSSHQIFESGHTAAESQLCAAHPLILDFSVKTVTTARIVCRVPRRGTIAELRQPHESISHLITERFCLRVVPLPRRTCERRE